MKEKAIALSWFTIGYNLVEGIISIGFGLSDDSLSLFGFGADSFIEVFSAMFVLWRFKGETALGTMLDLERERRATLGIGALFLFLALGTALGSVFQLIEGKHPETTVPGLVISLVSLSFMFFLWRAKLKVGRALNSQTVLKDAACSLACIQLSTVLFAGSLTFLAFPTLWWADGAAALLLAAFIAKEGIETMAAARRPDFSGGGCGCGKACS